MVKLIKTMSWNLDMRRLAEEEEERQAERIWAEDAKWIKWELEQDAKLIKWELEHPEEAKKIQDELYLEQMEADKIARRVANMKEREKRRVANKKALEERRIVRAQVSATGQLILMEKKGQNPVIVAVPGSLKQRNIVISPDGWATVVPRSGVLDTKTQ